MTTENIDIRIREDGSTVVRRNLESLAPAANKSASAVDFLKKALGALGGALAVREILRLVDTFGNLQNRLRATGLEGESLTAVYKELLAVSNATRSSVEGSVELYSRLAVSSKELGVSQKQLIEFTKTLNQTILLSGASAQEAQAGLIQLSQGLASGKLQGDELRSILENLPVVADVIAKSLKVTREELRQLGSDGKISAQVVLKAFQEARGEIEGKFAKTIPTLSQSFQVLRNNVLDFIGRIDQMTGFSAGLSKAIMAIANNIDTVAEAVVRLTKVLATAAVAYAAFLASGKVGALVTATQAFVAYRTAIAAGTVVVLGSAEAERQRAVAALAGATATQQAAVAQNAAAVASARAAAVTTAARVEQIAMAQASIAIERQELVAKLAKSNADIASATAAQVAARAAGAQSFALATLRTATLEQTRAEAARSVTLAELAALGTTQTRITVANTAATQANATAQLRLAEAQGAAAASNAAATAAVATAGTRAATATAAAAGTTSLLGQAMAALGRAAGVAGNAVRALFVIINTNPFTVLAVSIAIAIGLLVSFGDKFNAGIDAATTLKDVLQALGEFGVEALRELYTSVSDVFGGLGDIVVKAVNTVAEYLPSGVGEWLTSFTTFYDDVGSGFAGVVRGIAKTFDAIGGLVTGMVIGIARFLSGIPTVFETVFKRAYNAVSDIIEDMINTVIGGINKIRSVIGKDPIELVKFTKLEVDENAMRDYGASLAASIGDGFESQGQFLLKKVDAVFDRAQQIQQTRTQRLLREGNNYVGASDVATKPVKPPVDPKEMEKAANALRSLLDRIDPVSGALLELAKAQKTLNDAQKVGLINGAQNAYYYSLAKKFYEDTLFPIKALNRELDEQSRLLSVNTDEREVANQLLQISKDLQKSNVVLTDEESEALYNKLIALRDLNMVVREQDALFNATIGKRKEFVAQLQALKQFLATPLVSGGDKSIATVQMLQSMGIDPAQTRVAVDATIAEVQRMKARLAELQAAGAISGADAAAAGTSGTESMLKNIGIDLTGTQAAMDAQIAQYTAMYDKIKALRAADVIDAVTASQLTAQNDIAMNQLRLKSTQDFFGNLASLSSSGNKRIAAIGKAAAVTQATIDGVVAVQKALAAPPGWPYNAGNVIAVGVSAAANVAKIAGFEEGGYTGAMGTGKIAGVVHGQEYVVNADATKRNRKALEAMNAGKDMMGGGEANVTIIVNTPPGMEVTDRKERNTPDGKEVELTIGRAVVKDIRSGGPISQAFEGQYGMNRAGAAPR